MVADQGLQRHRHGRRPEPGHQRCQAVKAAPFLYSAAEVVTGRPSDAVLLSLRGKLRRDQFGCSGTLRPARSKPATRPPCADPGARPSPPASERLKERVAAFGADVDPDLYRRDILPKLKKVTLAQLIEAT